MRRVAGRPVPDLGEPPQVSLPLPARLLSRAYRLREPASPADARDEPGGPPGAGGGAATPAAVEAIVREVLDTARPVEDTAVPRRAGLRADLAVIEGEIARLTAAIARAPDLGSLLDALRAKEQRRAAIQAELAALDGLGRVRTVDATALTPAILAKLGDWSGLVGRRVGQARQILRHLLVGRITFTPQADGMVEFVGTRPSGR